MAPEPKTPSTDTTTERAQREIVNMRLTEDKLREELRDLRRPYLLRNSQLLTALIASVGAVVGASLLIEENYFKIREQRNAYQEEQTRRLDTEAKYAVASAAKAKKDADAVMAAAEVTTAEANKEVRESNERVKAANDRLAANARLEAESYELAAKAETLVANGEAKDAQDTAVAAWERKRTPEAQRALVNAFSLPIRKLEHLPYAFHAVFSPVDGQRIMAWGNDSKVRVWDSATGKELRELDAGTKYVYHAAFSLDGKRIVTAGSDPTARVWDVIGGKELVSLPRHTRFVYHAEFLADNQRVVTWDADDTARVWDSSTGKQLARLRLAERFASPKKAAVTWAVRYAVSMDGKRILTGTEDEPAWILDLMTGELLKILDAGISSAEFSPNGKRVATTANSVAQVWDSLTGKELFGLTTEPVDMTSFSPDGNRLLTREGNSVEVWDAESGKPLGKLRGHNKFVDTAEFSLDGKRVVTASRDSTTRVWDPATGRQLVQLATPSVTTAAFSPDGERIVTASGSTVAIYKIVVADEVEKLFATRR